MFTKASALALFAGIAAAVHAPVGEPSGNPITRPLNEVVPACKAFTISWQPTTTNAVSILLLRGPSTNVVPLGAPLAEGIPNSGSFTWTPSSELEADTTHYGLQLIDDVTGQFQYSTQFGISKDDCEVVSSSSADAGYPTASETKTPTPSVTPSGYPTPSASVNSTSVYPTSVGTSSYILSTGAPHHNSTVILPTKSMTVPSSLQTATATGGSPTGANPTAPPESTGAAAGLRAGLGLAGAVAGLVFML